MNSQSLTTIKTTIFTAMMFLQKLQGRHKNAVPVSTKNYLRISTNLIRFNTKNQILF